MAGKDFKSSLVKYDKILLLLLLSLTTRPNGSGSSITFDKIQNGGLAEVCSLFSA